MFFFLKYKSKCRYFGLKIVEHIFGHIEKMKFSHKILFSHVFFLFVMICQDTYVSQSFFNDDPIFYYISLALIFSTLVCYSGVLSDPGFLPPNEQIDSPYFCRSCQRRVPIRFFHCNKCHQCVRRQLYHSDLADVCIGFSNYMFYFLFLVAEFLTLLFLLIISFISLAQNDELQLQRTNWLLHHILLIILIPVWLFYLIQVSILLLEHCFIIVTNGNVLETRKFFGLTYLYIQPKDRNPFFSFDFEENLTEVFFPIKPKDYKIDDNSKLDLYNEDIQNYKDIDYVKDTQ